ncbi:MAG TPA: DNA polymerase/3'-5' exonuclease PolX [Bacteroidetes bacterium]|nr:DNA polymerase/3'-5' exonuclease PolX [Bacteroidota bacterium]
MPVTNKQIAAILNEVADLLEIKDENQFRIRSYRNAARTVSGLSKNITELAGNPEEIEKLPGIGESLAEKIVEMAETGKLEQLEKLKKELPSSLTNIMKLEQMGPRRTKLLYDKLHITSIDELQKAAKDGKIASLEGFGKKTVKNILKEIEEYSEKGGSGRCKLVEAEEIVAPLLEHLSDKADKVVVAGSYRRRKETVGDIDILATGDKPEPLMKHLENYEETADVLASGKTKLSVRLKSGMQVDLRLVEKKSYGSALLYFTGSKEHSVALRKIARGKGLKLNEYGLFKGKKNLVSETEEKIYRKLGLRFIEPELREGRGECEAARENKLPGLITENDIRGDLHTHSNATDGRFSIREMASAAREKGYEYLAITDHSKKVAMAHGLDEKRLREQMEEIDRLNEEINKFRILKSIEADILEDGSIDLPDEVLKDLDLVICSIHYHRNLSKKQQTHRVLLAMENPYFNILGHPTGRLINERSPYEIDLKKIMKEALEQGCFLEVNANPDRLDLNDRYILMAREMGLKLAISTDAHTTGQLANIQYGVAQARRGWLEKDDVINTSPWNELKKLLKRS